MDFEKVQATFADTATTPFAHSTSGSTTTFTSGLAALKAAEDAKRQILETASRLLEVEPARLQIRDGMVSIIETPEIRVPLGHVIRRHKEQIVIGEAKLRAGSTTHIINSFAAHFAEVEVDPETGCVRVLDPQIDIYNWTIPLYLKESLSISTTAPILPAPPAGESEARPPAHIYGAEIAHGWCYYFEKADLARQSGDWETIVSLDEQAAAINDQLSTFSKSSHPSRSPSLQRTRATRRWRRQRGLDDSAPA
jgi:hypothetical protein